jgi:hypothetical protein
MPPAPMPPHRVISFKDKKPIMAVGGLPYIKNFYTSEQYVKEI